MSLILDKKLDQKIIEHQKEIKQLQAVIHNLRTQNRDFSKKADKKLKLLNMSVDQMNQLTEDIQTLKIKTDKLEDGKPKAVKSVLFVDFNF